jgi:hypothetical protein
MQLRIGVGQIRNLTDIQFNFLNFKNYCDLNHWGNTLPNDFDPYA